MWKRLAIFYTCDALRYENVDGRINTPGFVHLGLEYASDKYICMVLHTHCRLTPCQRTPANIRIDLILPETRAPGLHVCCCFHAVDLKAERRKYRLQTGNSGVQDTDYFSTSVNSFPVSTLVRQCNSTRLLVLYFRLHALKLDMAVVLSVRLCRPFGTNEQAQFLKWTVCLFSSSTQDTSVHCRVRWQLVGEL